MSNPDVDLMGPRDLALEDERGGGFGAMAPVAGGGAIMVKAGNQFITAQRVAVQRDIGRVLQNITTLAAAAGHDWFYLWEAKNRDGSKSEISGLTIKGANAVARLYGNCVVDFKEVQETPTHWIFHAVFVDLETGFSMVRPFQQRKAQTSMGKDADRQMDIAFQIGASKATRNVVNNALETFANHAYEQARRSLVDKVGKRLDEYRSKVLVRLTELKVEHVRVERLVGKPSADWNASDVAKLIAELQAILDGMATPNDLWPVEVQQPVGEEQQEQGSTSPPPPPAADKAPRKPRASKADAGAAKGADEAAAPNLTPPAEDEFPGDRPSATSPPVSPPPAAAKPAAGADPYDD